MKKLRIIYCIVMFGFILGCHKGYLALWENEDPTPIHIFPYQIQALPVQHHAALTQGIQIENYSELVELLNRYLS